MNYSKKEFIADILVVDDDLNNLHLLIDVLRKYGYGVRPVTEGNLALASVREQVPDLILLNIMMPGIDSYEVCSQLKENEKTRHIPVIFLSVINEIFDKIKAFTGGGVDYITKPFHLEEAIARIENQLKVSELQKQLKEQNEQLQQEIRERQLMEDKLRFSQAKFRDIFEAMADIVLILDCQGKTIEVAPTNPEKLYPPDTDVLGETIKQFFGDRAEFFQAYIKQALDKQQVVNCEYSLEIGKKQIWFSASIAPTSENIVAWVARDISDRKKAEEALQTALLAADAANRAKSEFLASMSHELRTPLNAILGFSQIMSRDNSLSSAHQKNISIINRSAQHLLSLINEILEISKIESSRTTFDESNFNLIQLLDNLKNRLELKANAKGLELCFEYDAGIPEYIKTDESKLRQVLLKLLENAIKFTKVGKIKLRVSAIYDLAQKNQNNENEKMKLHFEIEDTGIGIEPEEIHLLFEAFGKTETGRKSGQGTGLGLSISRQYLQLMGGDIQVISTPDKGSLFTFDIKINLPSLTDFPINKIANKISDYECEDGNNNLNDRAENPELILSEETCLNLLSEMPSEWVSKIYYAACECSDDSALELIKLIPPEKSALASALTDLVDNFQFGQIIQLTQHRAK